MGADIALSPYMKYDDSTSVYKILILGEYYECV